MNWLDSGDSAVPVTIISIALMLAAGFLMTRVTKKLRLPNVTAYIVGGILSPWPSSLSAPASFSASPR